MKNRLLHFGFVLTFILALAMPQVFLARPAHAEDAQKPSPVSPEDIKKALGLSVYLQGGYTYNFKDPKDGENELRVFDHKANSFTLDLAEIQFLRDAPVGGVGYKVKVSMGETAKFIHSRGLGASDADEPFDLTEAYIDYVAPVGKGLKLRFGKFVTMHGAEVIEAKDDYNYSRSFLFNYAIPFTHTGFMAAYTFSGMLSANAYVVNGWDNSSDNNNGKTYGLSATVAPGANSSLVFNLMYGPEQDHNDSDNRFLFDWVGTVKPVKDLTLVVNTDYATDKNLAGKGEDDKWYGIAGYVNYVFTERISGTIRAELFRDPQGVRTGTPQNLKEVTVTGQYTLAKNLLLRPEYRHDWSNEKSFDSGRSKSQDTIALGVMYTW
ncbi:MAG: porin [Nitrospiraceae bacterium]|nr:porin [Nitrospiraceae bacterium]